MKWQEISGCPTWHSNRSYDEKNNSAVGMSPCLCKKNDPEVRAWSREELWIRDSSQTAELGPNQGSFHSIVGGTDYMHMVFWASCLLVILFLSVMLGVFVWGEGLITWLVFVAVIVTLGFQSLQVKRNLTWVAYLHLPPGVKSWLLNLKLGHRWDETESLWLGGMGG